MDLVGVRIVEVGHERLPQLTAYYRIGDGRVQVGPVAIEYQSGAVPGHVQGEGFEVLGAARLAAVFQELLEPGPPYADGLLEAVHAVEAAPGEPGEFKSCQVAPLVQPGLQEIAIGNPPLLLPS